MHLMIKLWEPIVDSISGKDEMSILRVRGRKETRSFDSKNQESEVLLERN